MNFQNVLSALQKKNETVSLSYIALRRLIGILGMALPFVCILGGASFSIQESISAYYYTNMRDFFVGLMFVVSLFLITYKGYAFIDFLVTTITGFAGIGVAVFPCYSDVCKTECVGIFQLLPKTSDILHLSCAGVFLFLLAMNSIFLFTKTNAIVKSPQKVKRNRIYVVCGIMMIVALLGILGFRVFSPEISLQCKLTLIFEAVALLAFGISWLVKGETLFKDKPEVMKR